MRQRMTTVSAAPESAAAATGSESERVLNVELAVPTGTFAVRFSSDPFPLLLSGERAFPAFLFFVAVLSLTLLSFVFSVSQSLSLSFLCISFRLLTF